MIPYSRYLIYPIPWYSVLILTGAALAVFLACRLEKEAHLPTDTTVDLALRVIPIGILGARCYYVLFSWSAYREDPLSIFRVWEGGLAIYGGILAGLLTVWVFCRRRRISMLSVCDIIVPGLALAQAIGRWGNYFNTEAYGWTVTDPTLCFFPFAVLVPGAGDLYSWHLATFFYESCWDFLVFLVLMRLRRRALPRPGMLFQCYAAFYAAGRLVIEELREDSLFSGAIRVSQLLSLAVVLALTVRLVMLRFKSRGKEPFPRIAAALLPPLAVLAIWALGYGLGIHLFRLSAPRLNLLLLAAFSAFCLSEFLLLFLPLLNDRRNPCPQPE